MNWPWPPIVLRRNPRLLARREARVRGDGEGEVHLRVEEGVVREGEACRAAVVRELPVVAVGEGAAAGGAVHARLREGDEGGVGVHRGEGGVGIVGELAEDARGVDGGDLGGRGGGGGEGQGKKGVFGHQR